MHFLSPLTSTQWGLSLYFSSGIDLSKRWISISGQLPVLLWCQGAPAPPVSHNHPFYFSSPAWFFYSCPYSHTFLSSCRFLSAFLSDFFVSSSTFFYCFSISLVPASPFLCYLWGFLTFSSRVCNCMCAGMHTCACVCVDLTSHWLEMKSWRKWIKLCGLFVK